MVLTGCSFWDWLAGQPVSGGRIPVESGIPSDETSDTGESPGEGEDTPEPGPGTTPAHGVEGGPPPGGSDPDSPPPTGPFEAVEILPVDQSSDDPSLSAFKSRLYEIIRARDVDALLAAVDEEVRNGFGDNNGIEAFKEIWGLDDDPGNSDLWYILSDILDLGGVFLDDDREIFVAPYVYALYDLDLDPFHHSVVTGDGVNVRAAPETTGPVLETVSYQVVRVLPADDEDLPNIVLDGRQYRWQKVQLPSGTVGYMVDRYLWSPVGYRLAFGKQDDGWRLIFLVAGD